VIIKNIIGTGWRGLASYLSQLSKSTTTDHINDLRIPNLHQPYFAFDERARLGKPAARFNSLPSLSQRNVDGFGRHGAVLLQGDAHVGLEPGRNGGTDQLRRPGHESGGDGQKGEPGAVAPFLTNLAGRTPREMAQEVGVLRRLRPNLTKAVSHLILGHDPSQRVLTETEWKTAIQIALKAHGAEETAFAAWIHFDTGIPHCHLMFSRVTPAGKVISDSNNFATNMRAARLIERTFMLDAPIPTPAEERPGDRQALYNASRRTERRGTPPPSKIDVKAIRAALADARDREHFLQLLAELGIEVEFDRRGVAREIYGWRLRRVGAAEWLKASTVAKDLSWPKIAHRFAESESMAPVARTPDAEQLPAGPVQAKSDTDKYARAPAPLRQMLREQHQQRQLVPAPKPDTHTQPTKKGWDIDLAEVGRATQDFGVLTKAMALLGAACIKYMLSFLKFLIDWISKFLAKLGFGVRETQLASGPQAVEYEPFTIDAEAREVPNAEAAAKLVDQVTAALTAKDAALLPDVEGRDAIAAAMLADPGHQTEENALDDMFATEVAHAATPTPVAPEAPPAAPGKSAWVMFAEAAKAYSVAASAVHQASLKDIWYVDGRPLARERHDAAVAEFQKLEKAHAGWKTENRLKSALGADPLNLKARAEAAQVRSAQTQAALLKAEKEHAAFLIQFDNTPTPTVPFAVQDRHAAAAAALNKTQQLLISKARLNLNILDANPMLRQRRDVLAAQVRRAETRLASFQADPRTQPKVVDDLDETLRALAAEVNVERARLAPIPDDEGGQPADAAGQHGHAVPGQR
jgi:hypothetical protein